jgi:hypothetical protein
MLSSHIIFGVVKDFAFEEIDKLIPNKYVRGKNHGKKQKGGGYLWDHRVDAKEKEKEPLKLSISTRIPYQIRIVLWNFIIGQ